MGPQELGFQVVVSGREGSETEARPPASPASAVPCSALALVCAPRSQVREFSVARWNHDSTTSCAATGPVHCTRWVLSVPLLALSYLSLILCGEAGTGFSGVGGFLPRRNSAGLHSVFFHH